MSENSEIQQPTPPPANKKKKSRKVALLVLTGVFVILAIAYLIYWFLVLRHFQDTDDAYVAGNQVQIMAQVSGSVTDVNFDSTDFVKRAIPWSCWILPMPNRLSIVPKRHSPIACVRRIN